MDKKLRVVRMCSDLIGRRMSHRHSGFTLVEMMIAMTIGLLIIGALTAVLISSARSSRANDRAAEIQNNGRYALDIIKRDIQHGGFADLTQVTTVPKNPVNITGDCMPGFAANFPQKIWGSDDNNALGAPCIPAANYARGDIFVVRYASDKGVPAVAGALPNAAAFVPPGVQAKTLYLRSAYGVADVTQNAISTVNVTPAYDHIVQVHVYYIAPWTLSAAENPQIPSLRRVVLDNTTGAMVDELVATGIENMQVQYGVEDSTSNGVLVYDANGNPTGNARFENANNVDTNAGINGTTPQSKWNAVSSVRIWLLARNIGSERNDAYINANTYNMGNFPAYTPNDSFRRQLYTTTVQLRN